MFINYFNWVTLLVFLVSFITKYQLTNLVKITENTTYEYICIFQDIFTSNKLKALGFS